MRVATRRIRAYLNAAQPVLVRESAELLRGHLAGVATALGEVRDLDVMIAMLNAQALILGEPDSSALAQLVTLLESDRSIARLHLISELDDSGYQHLLAELDETAAHPPIANPWADLHSLAAAEFGKLAKAHHRLVKMFGTNPPDDDLHALRMLGKRARYSAELLGRSPEVEAYLHALADFQQVLGDHQDASVLESTLRSMLTAHTDTALGLAAGRIIEAGRDRKRQARAAYSGAWSLAAGSASTVFAELNSPPQSHSLATALSTRSSCAVKATRMWQAPAGP